MKKFNILFEKVVIWASVLVLFSMVLLSLLQIRTKDFLEKDTVEKGTRLIHINPNKKVSISNTSGKTGVSFSKRKQNWQAYIYLKGKQFNLGYFDKKEDAIKARLKAEEEFFVPILEKYKDVSE